MGPAIATVAALIEFGGTVIVTVAVVRALVALGSDGIEAARLAVIGGSLGALGFKTAASLLKALELGTWHAIGTFAAILTLRTLIKRLFVWEQRRLRSGLIPAHAEIALGRARNNVARAGNNLK